MLKECPICKKKVKQINARHIKKCFGDDKEYKFKYIIHNYPKATKEEIYKLYKIEKWSIPMICNHFLMDIKSVCYLINFYGIKIRSIKETRQLKEYKERFEKTNIEKYGAKNPLSKNTVPYIKRNQTVLDKYGCENVFQRLDLFVENWGNLGKHSQISYLNKFLYDVLREMEIEFKPEFHIKYKADDGKIRWKKYDAKVKNVLIEVNGDYWHANPIKYKETQEFVFPGGEKITAKQIWNMDKYKEEIALANGYTMLTIWENDIKQNKDKVIENIKNYINRES